MLQAAHFVNHNSRPWLLTRLHEALASWQNQASGVLAPGWIESLLLIALESASTLLHVQRTRREHSGSWIWAEVLLKYLARVISRCSEVTAT